MTDIQAMKAYAQLKKENELSSRIISIAAQKYNPQSIDEEMSNGDYQGAIEAVIMQAIQYGKELKQ